MKIVSSVIKTLLAVFIALLILFNGWLLAQKLIFKEEMPRLFGYSQAIVISGSMEPALMIDDMIIARQSDSYAVGDIIVFRSADIFVTHRVETVTDEGYITKGDANNIADSDPVARGDVYGRVVYTIRGAGRLLSFIRTPIGTVIIIASARCCFCSSIF